MFVFTFFKHEDKEEHKKRNFPIELGILSIKGNFDKNLDPNFNIQTGDPVELKVIKN